MTECSCTPSPPNLSKPTQVAHSHQSAISNLPRGSTVIPSVPEEAEEEGEVGGANGGEREGEEEREEGEDEEGEVAEEGEGEGGGFEAAGSGCVERDPLDDGYWLRQVSSLFLCLYKDSNVHVYILL